ncbi:hypothetical protein VFPFJ_00683 [Purpureocillium lilacinum]|uniref:Uncharacterized protein n=1 Tax=Purpureocillium lilacinum TaxID=33203 RepID=A0A179HX18_PURLI|nr:hypothetical protein VFPFJ_00683 [Purpureocillium lilacinum]OAQ86611.1 hypothetical protein VFPBJ_00651 [Purpureocillium lilacinum]OAQ94574.1 hypothetical protein VFPFJ_00683 [Purpureocillium lilacinum]
MPTSTYVWCLVAGSPSPTCPSQVAHVCGKRKCRGVAQAKCRGGKGSHRSMHARVPPCVVTVVAVGAPEGEIATQRYGVVTS